MKIAVLVSGRGSNLKALIEQQTQNDYEIALVISNKANAGGLRIAEQHKILTHYIDWSDGNAAEKKAACLLAQTDIELVVLAGFMKILSPSFIETINTPIINIHPSLLPAYPGLNTHQRVLNAGDTRHGASVHVVNDQLDAGCLIAQTIVEVYSDDNVDTLSQRVLQKEHKLLAHVVGLLATGVLTCTQSQVLLNQQPLTQPLLIT
ncbi:phosphoribosylglycinamide formyltransferase [Marinicella sp. W31]|uniref:phosphoribosylglycinamide formyltransferase n=1 Tax=Marinicella sp. W31 TaxID=3023713 RepID=UPI0037579C9B